MRQVKIVNSVSIYFLIVLEALSVLNFNSLAQINTDTITQIEAENNVPLPFMNKEQPYTIGAIAVLRPDDEVGLFAGQYLLPMLEYRVPGLRKTDNIRGIGNALVVIDGIPRQLTDIRVEEVESVTILKDAQTALLYGPQARFGAILIKTKKGTPGIQKVNLYAENGMGFIRRLPQYLGAAEYMRIRNQALKYEGRAPQFDPEIIQQYQSGNNPYRYPDVDYYSREYIKRYLNFHNMAATFSGGNQKTTYFANLGWSNRGSLYNLGDWQNTTSNIFSIRANLDYQISPNIKGYVNGSFNYSINNQPVSDYWNSAAIRLPQYFAPLLPVSLIQDENAISTAKFVKGDYILGGSKQYPKTFYGDLLFGGTQQDIYSNLRYDYGLKFDVGDFIKGLKFNSILGFDLFNFYTQSIENEYAVYSPTWYTGAGGIDSISRVDKIGRDLVEGIQKSGEEFFYRRYNIITKFEYSTSIAHKHNISAILLGYYNQMNQHDVVVHQKNAHIGFQADYNFDNRYLAQIMAVISNSIKLPHQNRIGFSPSIGMAWIVSNESFFPFSRFINFLKVDAKVGIRETDDGIGEYYLYRNQYSVFGATYRWNDGALSNTSKVLDNAASQNIDYEKMMNFNAGIYTKLFNNKLNVSADFFISSYAEQLVKRAIYPVYLGNNIPYENFNRDNYKGMDFGADYVLHLNRNFQITLGGNFLIMSSKRIQFDEVYQFEYQKREGHSTDAIFGLAALGFFTDSNDIMNSKPQAFGNVLPGDLKYKDQNNDGIIDARDEVKIGNTDPRFSYGVHFEIKYKKFSLVALGGGELGSNWILSGDYFRVDGNDKYSSVVYDYWTPETAGSAKYPRLTTDESSNNYRNSTFWLRSGNRFDLHQLQFNFYFKPGLNWWREGNIYLRGSNLITVMKDDETVGLNIGSHPELRNFSIGLKFGF